MRTRIATSLAVLFALAGAWAAAGPGPAPAADPSPGDFDRVVAPLLAQRCLDCHNPADHKGKLDLTRAAAAMAGGENGPAIVAGKADESLLWKHVDADEMPPKHPLPREEKAVLRRWIEAGAKWGIDPIDPFRFTTDKRAGYDWWSLRPATRPAVPAVRKSGWVRKPIDAFVLAKLEEKGLTPSPEADRRALARRLSFDLTGLPPTPEEADAFLGDASPDAYERFVDRLLASPHYGEHWARHWLDVVRFGESHGFERDQSRPNAWRYRDWVAAALNRDLPYDRFARMQLAGDVIDPGDSEGAVATGFLVAGAYDEVGQTQQSAAMKLVVRQDEMEDLVGTTMQTFLGLTANCARCHDHKFDPIRQSEYYQLAAALAGVRHGERDVPGEAVKAEAAARDAAFQEQIDVLTRRLASIDGPVRERLAAARAGTPAPPPEPLARWAFDSDLKDAAGMLHGTAEGTVAVADGRLRLDGKGAYVLTAPLAKDLREKTLEAWVSLADLSQRGGGVIGVQAPDGSAFDGIVFGEREPRKWTAGSEFFKRTKAFDGPDEDEADRRPVHVAVVYAADGTVTAYRNGARYGKPYKADGGPVTFKAGQARVVFGLRHSPAAAGKLLAGSIDRAALYDRALSADEVARSAGLPGAPPAEAEVVAALSPESKAERERLTFEVGHLKRLRARANVTKTYACFPAAPPVTSVLRRGNPAQPGEPVSPAGIAAVAGLPADWGLPADATDADRRRRLAGWIADGRNPLFARVMVNRLWQYHFGGAGLVETPSDFGFNGGRPSHPELLDWLACEFRDPSAGSGQAGGWGIKRMHRLIVTSAAYRQATREDAAAAAVDAGNRLLWRAPARRLEAEGLRDAILAVSGQLNDAVGGPGYEDYYTFTNNTTFYEPRDYVGASFNRRSFYRTWIRSGRSPLLDVFDCPDPSTRTPKRAETTTPLQALALLNNSFVLRMADAFAGRLRAEAGDDPARQVGRAYELALCRPATADEVVDGKAYADRHGLAAFCRVLFNSNEFLYTD